MIKVRMPIFLFLFHFLLHRSEILDAKNTKPNISNVCSTAECKFASSIILQYMDPKAAPCDDFNKFVCGTFLKNTTIPKGKSRVNRYDIIHDKILEEVKVSLEEKTQPNEPRWTSLAKNYYKACANTAAIEQYGLGGISGDLKQFGGWPVLEKSWNETKYEWKQTTYTMQKLGYGASYFFNIQVITDPLNSKKRMLKINQPFLSIGREFLVKGLNNTMVTAYFDYIVDIAVLFGASRDKAINELKESLKFEINLATISRSDDDTSNQNALNNRTTVADLSKKIPSIPWKVYFNKVYSSLNSSIVVGDNEPIIVGVPTFFENFETLMKNTTKRVQANYQLWKAIQDDLDLLTDKIRQRKLKFTNMLNGKNVIQDRRQYCLDQILGTYLKLSVGALYVRKHFSQASKKSAEDLAVDIEKQYKKIIQEAKWMDEKTRKNALNRLASMKNFIGCPNEFFDDKTLNEFFKKAVVTPNNFFQAASTMSVFIYEYDFNQLRQPVNTSHWILHGEPTTDGPFFSIDGNGIGKSILLTDSYKTINGCWINKGNIQTSEFFRIHTLSSNS